MTGLHKTRRAGQPASPAAEAVGDALARRRSIRKLVEGYKEGGAQSDHGNPSDDVDIFKDMEMIERINKPRRNAFQDFAAGVEGARRITEDDPRWDCRTMGNKTCGPKAKPPLKLGAGGSASVKMGPPKRK